MARSKQFILQFINHYGGDVDSYLIVDAFSALDTAHELVDDGMLERIQVPGRLDRFRLTEAGRQQVKRSESANSTEY